VKSRALSLRQKPEPAPPPTRGVVKARDKGEPAPAPESAEARRVKFEALDSDIDDLMTHAEEVRVAGKKAVARLREGAETRGFLEFLKSW